MRLFILSILLPFYFIELSGQCNITVTCRATPPMVECSCEIEEMPEEFIGIPSDNSNDITVFEGLGFSVSTSGPCGELYVKATDEDHHPTSCTDTFYTIRRYEIGSPFGGTIQSCTDTFFTEFIPPHFLVKAQSDTITCKDDVANDYQAYIDNYSYSDFLDCYPQTQAEYSPDTSPVLASICGGRKRVRPLIKLSGPCTAKCLSLGDSDIAQTISNFIVEDDFKTVVTCPPIPPIDVSDPDLQQLVEDAIAGINLSYECDEPIVTNDFHPDSLTNRIFQCNPEDLIVKVDAEAGCSENSSSCTFVIELENNGQPMITKVPDTLFLECGGAQNLEIVNNWLAQTSAVDYLGNTISNISNNFTFTSLTQTYCNSGAEVTFNAIDMCGRADVGYGWITFEDTVEPEILVCPQDTVVNADDPNLIPLVTAWLDQFSANDDCNPNFQAYDDFDQGLLAFNCGRIDTVVTFTADDMCIETNIATCSAKLTVLDNVMDQFFNFPTDTTIQCENPINSQVLASWTNGVTAGNTLGTPFAVQHNLDFTDMRLLQCDSVIEVEFKFLNQCGVEKKQLARVTVTDDIPPTVLCPPDNTINDQDVTDVDAAVTAWLGTAIPQDNCSATTGNAYDSFQFSDCTRDTITNPIVFWAQDGCGNRSLANCQSNLTLITQKQPKITCPNPIVLECGSGNIMDTIQSWMTTALGTNFLGDDIGTSNDLTFATLDTFSCMQETMVAFLVEDTSCDRRENCSSMITIRDSYNPTVMCPANLTIASTSQTIDAEIQSWLASPVIEDNNCEIPLLFDDYDLTNDFCANSQTINVIFTVKDKCNRENSCAGLINIDNSPATLNCPAQDLELECGDPNNLAMISAWLDETSALDNNNTDLKSSIISDFNTNSLDTSCLQTIPVLFMVTDICAVESTCSKSIVIRDTQAPEATCPTLPLNLLGGDTTKLPKFISWLELVPVEDCNGYTITEDFDNALLDGFSCTEADYPFTMTFTDDCGLTSTCQAQINIQNNIQTSFINCSPGTNNFTAECGSLTFEDDIKQWMSLVSAEDIFGSSFPTTPDLDFSDPRLSECDATIPIVFELVDLCGNSQSCDLTLTIDDTTRPEAFCPPDTSFVLEDTDFTVQVADWLDSVVGIDNCNAIVQEQSNYSAISSLPACTPSEEIDVTFTILDGCGNTETCNSILTVTTVKVPSISCPGNQIVECGDPDTEDKINQWLAQVAGVDADNIPLDPQYTFDINDVLAVSCDGSFPILFTIIDNCTIEDTCSASIIVQDLTPPLATCPPPVTINSTDPDGPQKMQEWIDSYNPTDNCSMATASIQTGVIVPTILCNVDDEMKVEFYAEDACGLKDTCESIITINKDAPTFSCPGNLNLQCGESSNDEQIRDWLELSGSDNNGQILDVTNDFSSLNFSDPCESSTPVAFSLTDNCGFEAEDCLILITQKDTLAPEITNCPMDIVLEISDTDLDARISDWRAGFSAEDVCNNASVEDDFDLQLGAFDCGTDTVVVFTAIDLCGNTNSNCSANISFENNLDVEITCPEAIRVKCNEPSTLNEVSEFFLNFQVDSQDPIWEVETDITLESLDLECTDIYTQEVVFDLVDNCGNFDDCTSSIEFIPNASVYIPTIFRPSADGDDGFFAVRTNIGIENITSLKIYSRWGDLMYDRENFDPNLEQGWDGRNQYGNHVQGVYTFALVYDDIFGNSFEKIGTLTLIE